MSKKNWLWSIGILAVVIWIAKRKTVASNNPATPVPGPYGVVYLPGTNTPVYGPGY